MSSNRRSLLGGYMGGLVAHQIHATFQRAGIDCAQASLFAMLVQDGASRANSHQAPACGGTASSAVLSQLSAVSSMSSKSRCLLSCKGERLESLHATANATKCFGHEHVPGTAQMSGVHQSDLDLLVWPALPLQQLPSPPNSPACSMMAFSPPVPGSPLSELQTGAYLPPAPSQQSLASAPQSSSPQPASSAKRSAATLPVMQQLPDRLGLASAGAPFQSLPLLSASKQPPMPMPHQLLRRPEESAHSAPCSSAAPACLSRLQSISSSSGSQVHCVSASGSQAGCAAGQATSVILHWRLGQHSHVHGSCAMMTLQPSAEGWPGADRLHLMGCSCDTSICILQALASNA